MIALLILLGAVVFTSPVPPLPIPQGATVEASLPAVREYIERYFATFPTQATQAGRHDLDEELENLTPERRAAWLRFNRETLGAIESLRARGGLNAEDRLDLDALEAQANREIITHELLNRPDRDPLYWTAIIEGATVFLLVRDDLPLTDRLQRVLGRTRHIPRLVRQAQEALSATDATGISAELCRVAAAQAKASAGFYASALPEAAAEHASLAQALRREGATAAAALSAFAQFLERLATRASGSPRLGRHYAAAFRWGTGIDESPASVLVRFRRDLVEKRRETARYGREVWSQVMNAEPMPSDDAILVRRLFDAVATDADPDRDSYLRNWRATITALEAFVRSRQLITLPDPVTLHVDTAPSYFLGQSVGGVYPSGPFSPEAKTLFFLPVPPPSASADQARAFFRDFNRPFTTMIAAHELMPGHYTQLKLAARHPRKVRALFPDGVYTEGWGTFSERLLLDEGWGGPLPRLAHLKKQLENIARAIVDIRVHTEGMTQEQVFTLVKDEALQGDQLARNMWMRTLTSPVQLTTYHLGYQQMHGLYEDAKRRLGPSFDLRAFMDGMMRFGPVPLRHYARQ